MGAMSTSARARRNTSDGLPHFARDVVVNVFVNLIAAGVIYVVAALAGLFPRNTTLFLSAAGFIVIGTACALLAWGNERGSKAGEVAAGMGFVIFGAAAVSIFGVYGALHQRAGDNWCTRWSWGVVV
jgi:hypothetical protein